MSEGLSGKAWYDQKRVEWGDKKFWVYASLHSNPAKKQRLELRGGGLTEADCPDRCPCCGKRLDYGAKQGTHTDNSPSLDQIEASGGYTPGNVQVICRPCNVRKSDSSIEDLRNIADFMEEQEEERMNNRETVRKHLHQSGHISPLEALFVHKIQRLAPRIKELRDEGMPIDSVQTRDEAGTTYTRYVLHN